MIRHIIKICGNQKAANVWIWLEMIVVSLILWFVIDTIYSQVRFYFSPLGHNINHVYLVKLSSIPGEPLDSLTNYERIQVIGDRIRTYKGVEAVSLSARAIPYAQGMIGDAVYADTTKEIESSSINYITPDYFRVFRCMNENGDTSPLVEALSLKKIVINGTLKESLYSGHNPIGKKLYVGGNNNSNQRENVVGEVIPFFRRSEYERPLNYLFISLTPEIVSMVRPSRIEVCVRVSPEDDYDFPERFKREMSNSLTVGNLFISDVIPMSIHRKKAIIKNEDIVSQNGLIGMFLLLNIFLGVAGTFWYRTRQRKNEMGLRIAMGSTRSGLLQLMIGEGLVLLTLSILPAVIIAFNIGLTDMMNVDRIPFTMNRFLITQGVTVWLMALMVCIGIYFPARSISRLQPADALRYE
ncbi:MAG: ABC transporter permease [Bacteroidales bacterium]